MAVHPEALWYTGDVSTGKQEKWKAVGCTQEIHNHKRLYANHSVGKTQHNYFHDKVADVHGNQQELFQIVVRTLLNKRKQAVSV